MSSAGSRDEPDPRTPRIVYRRRPAAGGDPGPEDARPPASSETGDVRRDPYVRMFGHSLGMGVPLEDADDEAPEPAPTGRRDPRELTKAVDDAGRALRDEPNEAEEGTSGEERGGRPGRGAGVWILSTANLLLAAGLGWLVHTLVQIRNYEIDKSFDVAHELEAALAGLDLMTAFASILLGGFIVSALAVFSLTRAGWFLAMLWAVLMTLTGIGAAYGLPAALHLARGTTRRRYFPPPEDADL